LQLWQRIASLQANQWPSALWRLLLSSDFLFFILNEAVHIPFVVGDFRDADL
jgi:hypothetical protein